MMNAVYIESIGLGRLCFMVQVPVKCQQLQLLWQI
ncbi:hypothetical protein [Streptococcus equi]